VQGDLGAQAGCRNRVTCDTRARDGFIVVLLLMLLLLMMILLFLIMTRRVRSLKVRGDEEGDGNEK
jgi:hypothetical protein